MGRVLFPTHRPPTVTYLLMASTWPHRTPVSLLGLGPDPILDSQAHLITDAEPNLNPTLT